ncbi:MAG: hypothetical protein ACKOAH_24445, partial [Pirellula sp.]
FQAYKGSGLARVDFSGILAYCDFQNASQRIKASSQGSSQDTVDDEFMLDDLLDEWDGKDPF